MNISKVGRRGQIAIPSQIRQELNLQEGDRLAFIRRGDDIVLQPLQRTLLDLRGSIHVTQPQDFAGIRQQVVDDRAYRKATDEQ
ncbi:MAG: AbrB/MazE/SpoVT family DNA-binding domain-containing protein [Leptolyngbyaceae bacterium]|nr:AbrB/MazE/SpoVT family DNA-binding domain-containing protein [Leptolyngbyaceae bacterium]